MGKGLRSAPYEKGKIGRAPLIKVTRDDKSQVMCLRVIIGMVICDARDLEEWLVYLAKLGTSMVSWRW